MDLDLEYHSIDLPKPVLVRGMADVVVAEMVLLLVAGSDQYLY